MELHDVLLRPNVRLLKVFIAPLLAFVGFVIFTFMRGFGSNKYEAVNPAIIELGAPLWIILLLALVLFWVIAFIIKIFLTRDIHPSGSVILKNNQLIVDHLHYKMTFKLKQAEYFSISISKFWGLLFPGYYRIGKVSLTYQGDSYRFLFPVRDMIVEQHICTKALNP